MADGSTRGWTSSKLELIKIQLLDRVHQETKDGEIPGLYSYAGDVADDGEMVQAAAGTLVADGLVDGNASYGGSLSPFLMPAGKTVMLERRERRSDSRKRAVACRDALLDWCYGHSGQDIAGFADDVRAHFEGDPFTQQEIISASNDLQEKEYITIAMFRPQITAKGKTVVESYDSSIANYENRSQPAPSGGTVINVNTGRITGQLSIGDNNRLTRKTGTRASELTELIAAVLEAAKGTPEEQRVARAMAQLELEADGDEPDPTIIGKVLERATDIAEDTVSDGLKSALKKLVYVAYGWYLQQVGTGN
jgi:hypothetical protein